MAEEKNNNRKILKKALLILAIIFVVALVFNVAMFFIGIKTEHLQRWAEDQYFGEIIEVNGDNFVIRGQDHENKAVVITKETKMKKGPHTVQNAIKIGEKVMVIGPQDKEGKIDAQLIRIFDPNDPINKIFQFFHSPFSSSPR